MEKDTNNAAAIGIIGGTDGPTAIFTTGPSGKLPLKAKIRTCVYQIKCRRAAKKITPGTHSLAEVATYARERYHAVEADRTSHSFIAQKRILREYLQFRQKDASSDIPMDFHIYEIRMTDSLLELAIDYINESFGVSYSGKKKAVRQLQKITKDLYLYYGVKEEDIQNKTQRYQSLLGVLSR